MIRYRDMLESDIESGLDLCRFAGWNQLENDWKMFLQLAPRGARVAINDENKVIGTVATIAYENRFSWIGMVLVHPEMKRQGIGTNLLREALNILQNQETVKLDATPAGREVYLKFDFRDEYNLSRMMATGLNIPTQRGARSIRHDDFDSILETDEIVFGASRKNLLSLLQKNAPQFCFVSNDSNRSYCFGRNGYNFTQIGPVIATDLEQAISVAAAALNNTKGPVILDVIKGSAFAQWLSSIGFMEQRDLIRMYRGPNKYPGEPSKQFAILGPEFG